MSEPHKYFVFSDESGSWHDPDDIYVRAWVVISESAHLSLTNAIGEVTDALNCREVRWKILAVNPQYFGIVDKFDFRVFLTVSSPGDIHWERKYRVTRNFETQIQSLDFGEIGDTLTAALKKKMYDDVKNVLFLNYYEKTHIECAKEGIERVLAIKENILIYRVDPPQMSKDGWRNILQTISPGVAIEFPKSESDPGIQFADTLAGCVRSFLVADHNLGASEQFIRRFRGKMIGKSVKNPNPNLIFYTEINDALKERVGQIWKI